MMPNIWTDLPLFLQLVLIFLFICAAIGVKLIGSDCPPPKEKDESQDKNTPKGYGGV